MTKITATATRSQQTNVSFFNNRKRKAHSKKHETKQKRWKQSNQLHEHAALHSQATEASDHYMSHYNSQ